MNCPKCNEPVENGAAFCGNCGQQITVSAPVQVAQPVPPQAITVSATPLPQALPQLSQPTQPSVPAATAPNPTTATGLPSYAVANLSSHTGDTKALLSLLFGIIGIVGSIFMALFGLVFGIAGLVLGSMSRKSHKKGLSTAGLILSGLSIVVAIAIVAFAMSKDPALNSQKTSNGDSSSQSVTEVGSDLSTPCYSIGLVDRLNIDNAANSCDMKAFDGDKFEDSTVAYKIYANKSEVTTTEGFYKIAKSGIDKDISTNLKGYKVDSQQTTKFAGSPAYVVKTTSPDGDVSVIEAAVYHKTPNGNNVFVLVAAKAGGEANLQLMESQWRWK